MKKTIILIIVSIMIFLLTGCNNKSYEYHPENKSKKEAETYFEYLKNKDIKELNKLFSKEVQATHNLEEEWEEFFNSIDGNIIRYEKISYLGEEVSIDKRKVTYSDITIRYENVKTDTGKTYERIDYNQIRVNTENRDSEGINIFSLKIPAENNKGFKEINVGEPVNK